MQARTTWVWALGLCTACRLGVLDRDEARETVEEVAVAFQAEALASASLELSTTLTTGEGVDSAASSIAEHVREQLPCAQVEQDRDTITVDYAASDAGCAFLGYELSGFQTITVLRADEDDVRIEHEWDDLSDGVVRIDGSAELRFALDNTRRQVSHDLRWTSLEDGRTGEGSGSRLTRPLGQAGLEEGLRAEGTNAWEGDDGRYELDGEELEMRWGDPLPEAGWADVETPYGDAVELEFFRLDSRTIKVRVETGYHRYIFHVSPSGRISNF